MDAITAGVALAIVQLCSSVIMAGVFFTTPAEKYTRYWALSGVLVGFGLVLVVLNAYSPPSLSRNLAWLLGYSSLYAGSVAVWCGLRAFYMRRVSFWALFLVLFYSALFAYLLFSGASFTKRSYVTVPSLELMFLLYLVEMMRGVSGPQAKPYASRTFGMLMACFAGFILFASYALRIVLITINPVQFEPATITSFGVWLIYLIPLGGSLLLTAGLLLLYFERLVADKHRLATEDVLTGTLNRRELVNVGERALQAAIDQHHTLTLAFIDVDHFKKINDSFGHLVGDRVLATVAATLRQNCREQDVLGRYGGEEFCIVFPGLDQQEASRIGERLVDAVRAQVFDHAQAVTISVGLVVLQPNEVQSWDSLIHLADMALYRAKAEGRDSYCLSPARAVRAV
ncbi:GGDEF domain-containing protein [Herbaspirillum lusitanum]|uniref:diguanylate cyclase n=1 Tax=Herbaspirillum lusitanum TaxID=213312 RepID=A0ABW9ACW1_9BURK